MRDHSVCVKYFNFYCYKGLCGIMYTIAFLYLNIMNGDMKRGPLVFPITFPDRVISNNRDARNSPISYYCFLVIELLYEGSSSILFGPSVTCRVDLLRFAGDRMNYCISGGAARDSASLLR